VEPTEFQEQCALWAQYNVRDLGDYVCWEECDLEQVAAWDQLIVHITAIRDATPMGGGAKNKVKTLLAKIKAIQAVTVKLNKDILSAAKEGAPTEDTINIILMLGQYFAHALHWVPDESKPSSDAMKMVMKTPGMLVGAMADAAPALTAAIPVILSLGEDFPDLAAKQVALEHDAPRTKFTKEGFVQSLVTFMSWPTYWHTKWNDYSKKYIPLPEAKYTWDQEGGMHLDHGVGDPIHDDCPWNLAADTLRVSSEYLTLVFAGAHALAFP